MCINLGSKVRSLRHMKLNFFINLLVSVEDGLLAECVKGRKSAASLVGSCRIIMEEEMESRGTLFLLVGITQTRPRCDS